MGDLRPLGSEKLQGMDKIKRILEIAKYNEAPKQKLDENSTTNYTIKLADGLTYGIVREKLGYIIKKGLNESVLDYGDSMRHRKYYRSYSEAMKRLNLVASELNRLHENDEEIPLIGEQKKKFVLKTPKADTPPPAPSEPPAGDASAPPPPAGDMGTTPPTPSGDMGMEPPMGGDMGATPPPPSGDMGMEPPMGGDMGATPPPPAGDDMGMEPPAGDDMGMEPPMGDDMGMEDDGEEEPQSLKTIQKLTGKLSQKLRSFGKEDELDSQDIKYVINSIISAIDLSKLDDEDKEDILDKFEGEEEGDEMGMGSPEDDEMGSEPPMDDDMGMEEPDMGMEEPDMGMGKMPKSKKPAEENEGYRTMMDSIFAESKVENVLKGYFKVSPNEKSTISEQKQKGYLENLKIKLAQKNEVERLSKTFLQEQSAKELIEDYKNIKFLGKTNKNNLVFVHNNEKIKVTINGDII